jgi:hypothetical protein
MTHVMGYRIHRCTLDTPRQMRFCLRIPKLGARHTWVCRVIDWLELLSCRSVGQTGGFFLLPEPHCDKGAMAITCTIILWNGCGYRFRTELTHPARSAFSVLTQVEQSTDTSVSSYVPYFRLRVSFSKARHARDRRL